MSGTVIAALSHKGGTGRSVTTANVCYHLSKHGHDVCVVDMDLASPTFGAILGIDGISAGADIGSFGDPRSIGDFLNNPDDVAYVDSALRDAWRGDTFDGEIPPVTFGQYQLLPGSRQLGDPLAAGQMNVALDRVIGSLRERFDIIYLDLRSGASELLESLRSADSNVDQRAVDLWVVHMRWTFQHIVGLKDIVSMLDCVDAKRQFLVRTAFVDPDSIEKDALRRYVALQNSELDEFFGSIRIGGGLAPQKLLGTIPLEPVLQWREGVILEKHADKGLANEATVEAFSGLATDVAKHAGLADG